MTARTKLLAALTLSTLGCGLAPEHSEGLDSTQQAIRNCLPSHPDYPFCPAPTVDRCAGITGTLSLSPSTIAAGQSSRLAWSVRFPAGCVGQSVKLNGLTVASSGAQLVSPLATQAYRLSTGSTTLASATLTVTLPAVVRIKGSDSEWRRLLIQAVGTPNTRVVLENNVDMDMTGAANIYVVQGVTITSEAPIAAGTGSVGTFGTATLNASLSASPSTIAFGSLASVSRPPTVYSEPPLGRNAQNIGPRLYTTSKPNPLFHVRCNGVDINGDNVRFLGFRLQGPHWDTEEGDDNLETGIKVDSCLNVEIGHMEVSGWSGAAISIDDKVSRQFNPDHAVQIHDNFIHHNQHAGGFGYGVTLGEGGYAAIERNVFDFNRHAVTASGTPGIGYRAHLNLVLRGGGRHGKIYNEFTHQFDVHGDANCPDVPLNRTTWNCGNAGDQFWITSNAFQYVSDLSIKLRGVPRVQAVISGNVVAKSMGDAIQTKSSVNVIMGPNRDETQSYGKYGVCDFDGDGKDDLLLATGASWWYSSAGKSHWVYLNSHTELFEQLGFGDFDGDKRCDVVAANGSLLQISKGGTSAWVNLPGTFGQNFDQLRFHDFNGDKITDVFFRAGDGQWWVVSPGYYDWRALESSDQALGNLRFADMNGDGITDVLGHAGGRWAVSYGGTTSWQTLNSSYDDDLRGMLIGNLDGAGGDDIVRAVRTDTTSVRYDVSWGGSSTWQTLGTLTWSASTWDAALLNQLQFIGKFDDWAGADLLTLTPERMSQIFSLNRSNFAWHSVYAR